MHADQSMRVSAAFYKLGMVPQSVWPHPPSFLEHTEASRNEMAFVFTHTEDGYQEKCNFLPAEGSVYHMLSLSWCQPIDWRGVVKHYQYVCICIN